MDYCILNLDMGLLMQNRKILNKNGVSLIYVMLVLFVMVILSFAIFTLFSINLEQARRQEDSMRAHFVALSGVDVTFAALLQNNQELLNDYFRKNIDETIVPITTTISLDYGHADVEVSSYVESGYRFVLITSVASLDNSDLTKEIKMHFRAEHPEIQRYE